MGKGMAAESVNGIVSCVLSAAVGGSLMTGRIYCVQGGNAAARSGARGTKKGKGVRRRAVQWSTYTGIVAYASKDDNGRHF
jgi:hypothetical protein